MKKDTKVVQLLTMFSRCDRVDSQGASMAYVFLDVHRIKMFFAFINVFTAHCIRASVII